MKKKQKKNGEQNGAGRLFTFRRYERFCHLDASNHQLLNQSSPFFVLCKPLSFTFLCVPCGVKVSPPPPSTLQWAGSHHSQQRGRSYGEAEQRSVSLLRLLRFSLRLGRPNDVGTLNERERGQTGWGRLEAGGWWWWCWGGGSEGPKERRRLGGGGGVDLFQSAVGREEWPVLTELFSSRQGGRRVGGWGAHAVRLTGH